MRFVRPRLLICIGLLLAAARAQVPAVSQAIPAQTFVPGGDAVTLDLRNFFTVAGVTGPIVQFDTVFGRFNVELRPDAAPRHVENFLNYVSASRYSNSFFHRAAAFEGTAVSIVQGGGFVVTGASQVSDIATFPPVPLEYNLPNAVGTLAAARLNDVNSATSQWYFNTRDNSTNLGPSGNSGGYTVFGRVIGTGMTVVDQIAALQRVDARGGDPNSPFGELPVRNYSGGTISSNNLVLVNSVRTATVFPTGGGTSVVSFTVQNSASNIVQPTLSGSTLTLTPVSPGNAVITVRAVDTNGNGVETTVAVTVQGLAPVFTAHPASFTAAAGTTVVLRSVATSAASYRWEREGQGVVEGANSASLVINNVSAADAGTYRSIATNSLGTATSSPAALSVVTVPPTGVGRLINLSILSNASAGSGVLTVGAVVGPLNFSGSLPLLVRAVGPTLTDFGATGVLADPVMTLFASAQAAPLATNDNWSGSELTNAFTAVGAFPLRAGSADSAILRPAPGVNVGGYTVQVVGKADASGFVLAEIYDAAANRTATTPRLINVSVNKVLEPGTTLTTGFVLRGDTARTVLVRAVGPGLAIFGITDFITDPKLALFNASSVQIAENDNWGGDVQINAAGNSVGAFPITNPNSRDAMLLITLPPGDYSAQVNGVGGVGGTVLVEVYEIP